MILFLALRIPLAMVREPFFDELLTVHYAQQPLAQQWQMLRQDSGSPLYYALARTAEVLGGFTVTTGRILSLTFALLTLMLLSLATRHWSLLLSAVLLSVFPPHVFFSTEARAYALAALLVGLATVSLLRWASTRNDVLLVVTTLSLALSAYTHSYGVLFFPVPFLISLITCAPHVRTCVAHVMKGLASSAAASVLFLPGFWLASLQPLESIDWMRGGALADRLQLVLGVFQQLGFAAPYPSAFAAAPPAWLQILSTVLVLGVLIWARPWAHPMRSYAAITLTPLLCVIGFALAGKTFYFPMRFESVLSVPLVLWLGSSLVALPRRAMVAAFAAMFLIGLGVSISMIADHRGRGPDPFRQINRLVRQTVDPRTPLVASGYAYLELISQRNAAWNPEVIAFPREQARHPGWVGRPDREAVGREVKSLPVRFVWVGIVPSAESDALAANYRIRVIARDGPVVAAQMGR